MYIAIYTTAPAFNGTHNGFFYAARHRGISAIYIRVYIEKWVEKSAIARQKKRAIENRSALTAATKIDRRNYYDEACLFTLPGSRYAAVPHS